MSIGPNDLPDKDQFDLLEGGGYRGGYSFGYAGRGSGGNSRARPRLADKEPEYLAAERKLPKDVIEIEKGVKNLTEQQAKKLTAWHKNNKNFDPEIEVVKFSDGRAVYTFRVPAADKSNSYKIYEKHVSSEGVTIDTYALTIRDGKLYEVKNKILRK